MDFQSKSLVPVKFCFRVRRPVRCPPCPLEAGTWPKPPVSRRANGGLSVGMERGMVQNTANGLVPAKQLEEQPCHSPCGEAPHTGARRPRRSDARCQPRSRTRCDHGTGQTTPAALRTSGRDRQPAGKQRIAGSAAIHWRTILGQGQDPLRRTTSLRSLRGIQTAQANGRRLSPERSRPVRRRQPSAHDYSGYLAAQPTDIHATSLPGKILERRTLS